MSDPDVVTEIDGLCRSLLRGEHVSWPFPSDENHVALFVARASFHGVAVLMLENLRLLGSSPVSLRAALRVRANERAAWELRNHQFMQGVMEVFSAAGIKSLVYKGTALAYSLYANPVWRTRSDSDVLVPVAQLQQAMDILQSAGWQRTTDVEEVVWYKWYFTQVAPEGGEHNIDLHWKLSNSELLSGIFDFEDLYSRSVRLPSLSGNARTLNSLDALLVACMHRGVHRLAAYTVGDTTEYTGDRQIWLYDIDQLARTLSSGEWELFWKLAHDKGLTGICRESLALAKDWFATPLPSEWLEAPTTAPVAIPDLYLAAGPFQRIWYDFRACRGIRERLRFCRLLLFPRADYMRNKYTESRVQFLPWLYLRRMVEGALKRLGLEFRKT